MRLDPPDFGTDFDKPGPDPCVSCGAPNDADLKAAGDGGAPAPGSLSICWGCGYVSLFGDDLRLRDPSADELLAIMGEPGVMEAIRRIQLARSRTDHGPR